MSRQGRTGQHWLDRQDPGKAGQQGRAGHGDSKPGALCLLLSRTGGAKAGKIHATKNVATADRRRAGQGRAPQGLKGSVAQRLNDGTICYLILSQQYHAEHYHCPKTAFDSCNNKISKSRGTDVLLMHQLSQCY